MAGLRGGGVHLKIFFSIYLNFHCLKFRISNLAATHPINIYIFWTEILCWVQKCNQNRHSVYLWRARATLTESTIFLYVIISREKIYPTGYIERSQFYGFHDWDRSVSEMSETIFHFFHTKVDFDIFPGISMSKRGTDWIFEVWTFVQKSFTHFRH